MEVGESLLDSTVMGLISGFGADVVATVVGLIVVLIPVGLLLWSIGFAVKRGLGFLQKKASKAM